MIHSKSQNRWRMAGKRSLLLLAVLSLVITLLGLPLYAASLPANSPAGRMMDDIKRGARDIGRGVRDFGRDVGDMVDPDGDGILPDGSVDNGIANDGNQFGTGEAHGHVTGNVSDNVTGKLPDDHHQTGDGLLDEVMPNTPVTDQSRPSPDNGQNGNVTDGNMGTTTDHAAATTDRAETGDHAVTDNADGNENGGFRWTGLIIAIIIAVAVIVLICLLIPKKRDR